MFRCKCFLFQAGYGFEVWRAPFCGGQEVNEVGGVVVFFGCVRRSALGGDQDGDEGFLVLGAGGCSEGY